MATELDLLRRVQDDTYLVLYDDVNPSLDKLEDPLLQLLSLLVNGWGVQQRLQCALLLP